MSFLQSNTLFYIKDILPITTIAGGTFRISGELETGNPIETGWLDTFIVLKNGTQIERMSVTMTGGIATIVKRGLQQDGATENASLKKPWNDGTVGYITMKPKDLLGSGSTDIDFTFNGNVTFNKTAKMPAYADATARDIGIPSPSNGMIIYNTALGVLQQYIGGAWANNASGSVVNADTTTAGKVEIATQAEFNAGTDVGATGATLVAPPSVVNNSLLSSYIAGEALTANDFVLLEIQRGFAFNANTGLATSSAIGDATARTRESIDIIGNGVSASTQKLSLAKVGAPADSVSIRIETDTAGNPSGTLANVNATATVTWASLTTTLADTTVTFAGAFTLTDGVLYHIVISRVTAVDPANYYVLGGYTRNMRGFKTNIYNGTVWGTAGGTSMIYISYTGAYSSLLVKTSATNEDQTNFIGCVNATTAQWATARVQKQRIRKTFSSLTPNVYYYLSNTAGLISTTAGTVPIIVGISESSTELDIKNEPKITSKVITVWGSTNSSTSPIYESQWRVMYYWANAGNGASGWSVTLQSSYDGMTFTTVNTISTGAAGVSVVLNPTWVWYYRVVLWSPVNSYYMTY